MVEIKSLPGIVVVDPNDRNRRFCMESLFKQVTENSEKVFGPYLSAGKLVKHPPSIYTYKISFRFPKRYGDTKIVERELRGFIALVRVDDLLRHEDKHEDVEKELAASFKSDGFLMTPIMGMFTDKHDIIDGLFKINNRQKQTIFQNSDSAFSDPADAKHTLDVINDPETIARVANAMRSVEHLAIADGHHRFGALKRLKAKWVPVFFVDWRDRNLILMSWHRLVRAKNPKQDIRTALDQMLNIKQFSTYLYRAQSISDIRIATHPSEFDPGYRLTLKRRSLLGEQETPPIGTVFVGSRPLVGKMYEFNKEEILVSVAPDQSESWYVSWRREDPSGGMERLLLFGLYGAEKRNLLTESKYYLLGVSEDLPSALKAFDDVIKNLRAHVEYKNEIGVARELVNNGAFHAAVLVPVLRKQEVVNIAKARAYSELPAKFTCFLPKPGIGILITELKDLRENEEE